MALLTVLTVARMLRAEPAGAVSTR